VPDARLHGTPGRDRLRYFVHSGQVNPLDAWEKMMKEGSCVKSMKLQKSLPKECELIPINFKTKEGRLNSFKDRPQKVHDATSAEMGDRMVPNIGDVTLKLEVFGRLSKTLALKIVTKGRTSERIEKAMA